MGDEGGAFAGGEGVVDGEGEEVGIGGGEGSAGKVDEVGGDGEHSGDRRVCRGVYGRGKEGGE